MKRVLRQVIGFWKGRAMCIALCCNMLAGVLIGSTPDSLMQVWNDSNMPQEDRIKAMNTLLKKPDHTLSADRVRLLAGSMLRMAEAQMDAYLIMEAYFRIGAWHESSGQYDSSLHYLLRANEQAGRQTSARLQADAYEALARYYNRRGYRDSVKAYLRKALPLRQAHADELQVARLKRFMALAHYYLDELDSAIVQLNEAERLFAKFQDDDGLNKVYNLLGIIYGVWGDQVKSLAYFQEHLKYAEKLGEQKEIAYALHNIGKVHMALKEDEEATTYFMRALEIQEKTGDQHGLFNAYINLSDMAGSGEDDSLQLHYLLKAREIAEYTGDAYLIGDVAMCIGDYYLHQQEYTKARNELLLSLKSSQEVNDRMGIINAYDGLGRLELALGNNKQAVAYGEAALELAKASQNIWALRVASLNLWKSYKANGQMERSLHMHEQYISLRDSVEKEENKAQIMRMQFQYEFDKRETLLLAEQEMKDAVSAEAIRRKQLQRNAYAGGFGLMFLLAVVFLMQRRSIAREKQRSEDLLLNILPHDTAMELKVTGKSEARYVDDATVLFTDFKDFTSLTESKSPSALVQDLNECFSEFDRICEKHKVEKIKTIGDSYMAAGGLPKPHPDHALRVVRVAIEIQQFMERYNADKRRDGAQEFQMRIGIHSGPLVAGIVGIKKFQYDIWGDTVNTASRVEASCEEGKINISQSTYHAVKNEFNCLYRGEVQVKGKGRIGMYYVMARI